MLDFLKKYSLVVTVSVIFASLLVSLIVYNSSEYIIDPKDGSLKDTDVFGMLDGYVVEKSELDDFDKRRFESNPNENASVIGNVSGVLGLGYTLLIAASLAVIGMFVYNGINDPKTIKSSLAFLGGMVALYYLCKGLSASVVPDNYLVQVSVDDYKLAGGLLNMTYTLAIAAILSIGAGGILPLIRK